MSSCNLLFFDTFSHEASEVAQLDLVQFPKAVQVTEIRVIPLGARVKADFPGGVRLGATNPSTFEIEFFINDLSKRGAATFEKIGTLPYSQHGNIHLEFDKKSPTDGLLLRGKYNTITLAVYGYITKVQREPSPPKAQSQAAIGPQPPPEKVNPQERIRDWLEETKAANSSKVFDKDKHWGESEVCNKEYERDGSNSRERSKSRRKSAERSQSREKSWERSEKGSSRRESRRGTKEKERQKDKEREKERSPQERNRELIAERKHRRRRREDLETDDLVSYDIPPSRRRRSVDEWDDRSQRSGNLVMHPRTPPLEPEDAPHDAYHFAANSGCSDDGDGFGQPSALPPPILSTEMEAISDDEDLLDLPPAEDAAEEHFTDDLLDENEATDEVGNEETEGFEYEEIMSDEDDLPEYQYEDYIVEEWEDWIKPFAPHDLELPKLSFFKSPSLTEYEKDSLHWQVFGFEDGMYMGNKLPSLMNETALPSLVVNRVMDGDMSQDIQEETGETWVQAVEQVCLLLPKALTYLQNVDEVFSNLLTWIECGLNVDLALSQQQPVFKIRHMKAGLRLTTILLQCSSGFTSLVLSRKVGDKLLILNDQENLALSIRLLVFRCIDAILDTEAGIKYFIDTKLGNGKTMYENILELLPLLQQSRAKAALSVTIRKVHLYEVCEKLKADTNALVELIFREEENNDDVSQKDELEIAEDDPFNNISSDSSERLVSLPPSLVNSIVSCIKEINRLFMNSDQLLAQPQRWLPGSKQFQLPKVNQNSFRLIYTMFQMTDYLENITLLLVIPALYQHPLFWGIIKAFFELLVGNEHGLRYLAYKRKPTTLIIKTLLQYGEENRDTICDGIPLSQLGIHMALEMHIIHQLDCIAQLEGSTKRNKIDGGATLPDYSQAVVHFHALDSLLMSPFGKDAIVSIIGIPFFTEVLFTYLDIDWEEDVESNPSKAACFGYAVDLLSVVIKFQDRADLLEKYADCIMSFIPTEIGDKTGLKSEDLSKLSELSQWLAVAKNSEVFSYDKLPQLSNIVQDNIENLEKFPGELISSLRILSYLTIPNISVGNFDESNYELIEELKYKYATIQLFSADLHTHLINILSKLFSIYQQPFIHSSNFTGFEGGQIICLLKPTLALLKNILGQIIQVRNTEFKDLTAVIPLTQAYILLQAFPQSSPYYLASHNLRQEVINILLSYTQVIYTTEGEEVLSKSLWTLMIAEIFKYLMNAPHTMVSVITLLTELLPLPLPIQTQFPLSEDENELAVRVRKLWSAHLYSLAPTIHELIHRLGLATHPSLTHSLRKMAVALSDLSAPMALLVAKATLDLVLQTHRLDQKVVSKEDSLVASLKDEVNCDSMTGHASMQTTRALNMLASLVSHAPTKAAVLHLLAGGASSLASVAALSKPDEKKYSSLLLTWGKILTLTSKSSSHVAAQECLLTVIQYLLDNENAMHIRQEEKVNPSSNSWGFLMSGVPHKDLLVPLIETLIDILRNPSSATSIIQHSLKILSKLTEHSFGFFFIKSMLDMKKGSLVPLFRLLSVTLSKDNEEFVCLLQDLLGLCHLLMMSFKDRTQTVSVSEMASYIGWKLDLGTDPTAALKALPSLEDKPEVEGKVKKEEEENVEEGEIINKEGQKEEDVILEKSHPLKILEQRVVAEVGEEETMESLYEEISLLISFLEKESTSGIDMHDYKEPPDIGLESLQELFASRVVWAFPTVDDDLHSLWLSSPSFEDVDEDDVVPVNLMETCRKYADNFDFVATLHKLIKGQRTHSISPQKLSKIVPKYKPSAAAIRPSQRGRPYVAPLRGRSFGRVSIRTDPFRSRPPNTSRPPSLHVDDFVALESTGHQPTGPTGYNKVSFGRGKIMLDSMRGVRTRPRVDVRGRFFHRPFRGEGVRGMRPGVGMRRPGWIFRGEGSMRANFRGVPIGPRFLRGRPFMRGIKFIDRGRRGEVGRHMRAFR